MEPVDPTMATGVENGERCTRRDCTDRRRTRANGLLDGREGATYCAGVDDNFQNLMQELGEAINDAVLDSEGVDAALAKVRGSGIDVFLVLEATICVRRKDGEPVDVEDAAGLPEAGESIEMSHEDQAFLKRLRISVGD